MGCYKYSVNIMDAELSGCRSREEGNEFLGGGGTDSFVDICRHNIFESFLQRTSAVVCRHEARLLRIRVTATTR